MNGNAAITGDTAREAKVFQEHTYLFINLSDTIKAICAARDGGVSVTNSMIQKISDAQTQKSITLNKIRQKVFAKAKIEILIDKKSPEDY